jgi:hypothetical protein
LTMILSIVTLLDDTYALKGLYCFMLENIFILGSLKCFPIFTMKFSRNNFFTKVIYMMLEIRIYIVSLR